MVKETIYIPPDTEDYTGYTTYVLMGTGTSELESFSLPAEKMLPKVDQGDEGEQVEDYIFPETREERFLDEDLLEFYKKKGYET